MSYLKTDENLFKIKKHLLKSGYSYLDSDRLLAPLTWYIGTGRITTEDLKTFDSMGGHRLGVLCRMLESYDSGDYEVFTKAFRDYCIKTREAERKKAHESR